MRLVKPDAREHLSQALAPLCQIALAGTGGETEALLAHLMC